MILMSHRNRSFLAIALVFALIAPLAAQRFAGRVLEVTDGDTVIVAPPYNASEDELAEIVGTLTLAIGDAVAAGSSMMPQKKNPDPLELVRGKAGRAIGHLTGLLVTMKGLPTGYNKDLQEDKEPLFDAEDTLAVSAAATAAVVSHLTLRPAVTNRAASGLLLATDVADYLVSRGMPFRQAHEVVGAMVRQLLADGRDIEALSLDEWQAFSPLFADDVRTRVTAAASVRARRTPQSTHPDAVQSRLADLRAWLAGHG